MATIQRRMLSKEDEEATGPEVEVRREDQQKINKFSRLHQRELNLEDERSSKLKEKEALEDIAMELELISEDEKVPYCIGNAYFQIKATKALKMVAASSEQMDEAIGRLDESLGTVREEMSQLKVELYARFGRSINLET